MESTDQFIGRDTELAQLKRFLTKKNSFTDRHTWSKTYRKKPAD